MAEQNIKKLPPKAQSQLRSDTVANSFTNFVIKLTENAIESNATAIAIKINLKIFKLQIIDNGVGISKQQLHCIGDRYFTTKWNNSNVCEPIRYHGETIASFKNFCSRILIISKFEKENVLESDFNAVVEANHQRISKGTSIVLENVLGNVPVRQLSITPSTEFHKIKEFVRAVSVLYPQILFVVYDDDENHGEILRIERNKSTRQKFINLFPKVIMNKNSIFYIVSETENIKTKAMICKTLSDKKKIQMVFVNRRYVNFASYIQKYFTLLIQVKLDQLKFSCEKRFRHESMQKPIFLLNIECPYTEYDFVYESSNRQVIFKNMDKLKHCLVKLSKEFFKKIGMHEDLPASDMVDEKPQNKRSSDKFNIFENYFEQLKEANAIHGLIANRSPHLQNLNIIENVDSHDVGENHTNALEKDEDFITPSSFRLPPKVDNILDTGELYSKLMIKQSSIRDMETVSDKSSDEKAENVYKLKKQYMLKKHFKELGIIPQCKQLYKRKLPPALKKKLPVNYLSNFIKESTKKNIEIIKISNKVPNSTFVHKNKIIIKEPTLKIDTFHISNYQINNASHDPNITISPYFINSKTKNGIFSIGTVSRRSGIHNITTPMDIEPTSTLPSTVPICTIDIHDYDDTATHKKDDKTQCNEEVLNSEVALLIDETDATNCSESCLCKCHILNNARELLNAENSNSSPLKSDPTSFSLLSPSVKSRSTNSSKHDINEEKDENNNTLFDKCNSHNEKSSIDIMVRDNHDFTESMKSDILFENSTYSSEEIKQMDKISPLNEDEVYLKKVCYRRNCRFLSGASIHEVPKGILDINKSQTQLVALGDGEQGELNKLIHSFSMKNHFTRDNNGNSCLKIYPILQKISGHNTNTTRSSLVDNTTIDQFNCSLTLTKDDLACLKFIAQVDQKYLLAFLKQNVGNQEFLVIFDQHAVEERIRVEHLLNNYRNNGIWKSIPINPPIIPNISTTDVDIILDFQCIFQQFGLRFKFDKYKYTTIDQVPLCVHNRASKNYSNGSMMKEQIETLIKEIIDHVIVYRGSANNYIPNILHNTLNFEACRGAIKFGDKIPFEICISLIKKLSVCVSPFQCAHGRPSVNPLINLTKIESLNYPTKKKVCEIIEEMKLHLQNILQLDEEN